MTVPHEPGSAESWLSRQRPAPQWLTPDWPVPPMVRALSTLRGGGVSEGVFASLNLGDHVGDSAGAVRENRRALRAAAGLPAEPEWLRQVHGVRVRDLDFPFGCGASTGVIGSAESESLPRVADAAVRGLESPHRPLASDSAASSLDVAAADAAVTGQPGRVCAILTADCLPVLLASETGDRVGAAHAGWRGLAAGVIEATVAALGCPPRELLAWLGPAIGPERFEIGAEVREELLRGALVPVDRPRRFAGGEAGDVASAGVVGGVATDDDAAAAAFVPNARGRYLADLYALARLRLARLGVRRIYGGGECTHTASDKYFSHRRDGRTGRQATLIWLESPAL